jgi:hypothetical protein
MTQIQQIQSPSIAAGPRGIGARSQGGAYSQDAQQDIEDCDCFQSAITLLSGSSDVLAPPSQLGSPLLTGTLNYVVKTAGVDAMTAVAPRAGIDDGMTMAIYSDTANAHTITFSTACIATGAATLKTIVTFTTGFRGQGLTLRAFNGTWQVVGNTNCAFS